MITVNTKIARLTEGRKADLALYLIMKLKIAYLL